MLKITINEIIEEFGYNSKQISDMTGIGYDQVLNLKNLKRKYTKRDISMINTWLENRGKNISYVNFENKKSRIIYKSEQRGIVNLNEYRNKKIKEQRRLEREAMERDRNEFLWNLFREE